MHGPCAPCPPCNTAPAIVGEAETGVVVNCCGDILLGSDVVISAKVKAMVALVGGDEDQMGSNWALCNLMGFWSMAAMLNQRCCGGGGCKAASTATLAVARVFPPLHSPPPMGGLSMLLLPPSPTTHLLRLPSQKKHLRGRRTGVYSSKVSLHCQQCREECQPWQPAPSFHPSTMG
jgi:hypothetical protein